MDNIGDRYLSIILNEFIFGGHLLSLGASSVVYVFAALVGINANWDYLLVAYLSSQIIYLHNHYKEYQTDFLTNPERTEYLKKYVQCIPFLIVFYGFSAIVIMFFFDKFYALYFWILIVSLGLFYSKVFKKITKKILGFKNLFVSFEWSLLALLAIFYYDYSLNGAVLLMLVFVYLRFFLHECFSDIKDIESDKKENLLTFPIVFGKEKIINILSVLNIISFFPIVFGVYMEILPVYSLMILFICLYAVYYLGKAKKMDYNQNFLYNVLGDGEFILWLFFILLGKIVYA